MRRLFRLLTSRLAWCVLAFIAQFSLVIYMVFYATFHKGFLLAFMAISIVMAFLVASRKEKPAYKMVWIFLICILPPFGGVLYFLFGNRKLGYFSRKKTAEFRNMLNERRIGDENAEAALEAESPSLSRLSKYIAQSSYLPLWTDTDVSYFPIGEDFFNDLIPEIRKASRFIFIEYFIIGEGRCWDAILEELRKKAEEGVDVRVIYDDMGSISSLPVNYASRLEGMGIKAAAFNKVRMHINPRMNFRDHRKIFDIDGNVCYTGGLNLADEYMNEEIRFGHWKDNAVKLTGDAVWNFTIMFLFMWKGIRKSSDDPMLFRPTVKGSPDGYIQPFSDNPIDNITVAEDAYLEIINRAERYVWITTPYLIPDEEFMGALIRAAKSGIDVRIITPHIPDKKTVFEVSRSNYAELLEAGVRIFEYTPGFIHSKTFVSDDRIASVGTVNIDYRSFYLHFELAVLFFGSSVIREIKSDFEKTFELCQEQTAEECSRISIIRRFIRYILRLFSAAL